MMQSLAEKTTRSSVPVIVMHLRWVVAPWVQVMGHQHNGKEGGGPDPSARRLSLQRLRIRNTAAGVVHCLPRGSQCSQRSKVSCIGHCLLQGIWIGRRRLGAQINPTGAEHRRTAYASCRPCFHSEQYQLNTTSNPTAKQDFRNRQKTNW